MAAADQLVCDHIVHHHPFDSAHAAAAEGKRDIRLLLHQDVEPALLLLFGHIVGKMSRSIRTLLLAIGESSEPFEACLTAEVQQLLKLLLSFSRMPDYHSGTKRDAGHAGPEFGHQMSCPGPVDMTAHIGEHNVGDMLQRDVEMLANLGVDSHLLEHVIRKICRIRIMNADPFDAGDVRQAAYKLCQTPLFVEIYTVVGGILGNEHQLLDAPFGQVGSLLHYFLHRHGDVRPANKRYGTIGATAVTTFRNLEISRTRTTLCRHPAAALGVVGDHAEIIQKRVRATRTEPGVHFGNEPGQLVGIALTQAAEHD